MTFGPFANDKPTHTHVYYCYRCGIRTERIHVPESVKDEQTCAVCNVKLSRVAETPFQLAAYEAKW